MSATAQHRDNTGDVPGAPLRVGDALIAAGLVSRSQVEFVLQKQAVTGEKLGELVLRMGIVSEYDLARILARQRGIGMVDLDGQPAPEKAVLEMFNQEFCLRRAFLPLRREGDELVVAAGNADYDRIEQAVNQRTGLRCRILQAEFNRVMRAIRHHYYFSRVTVEELCRREAARLDRDLDQVVSPDAFLDHLFHLAVKQRASDIHIQPEPESLHVLFRIDGVLRPVLALSPRLKRVVAALKMTAGMDISDNLRPQDGSFSVTILDSPFDVRMSTLLTDYGESVVMRLLPSGMQVQGLNQLGFRPEDIAVIETMFANPYGIMLMTGPTGAGKSTTLHAGLRVAALQGRNVLTVEDPIEYKLPIVRQTQVNRKAGYLFDTAVTHFLRHDPDVILIGEIRDRETARAALAAAETGHLVLSTLHVNGVFGVVPRLQALGVAPRVTVDSLIGVINQRLVRRVCPLCREEHAPDHRERAWLGGEAPERLARGRGCDHCGGTGYFGRMPLYEILTVTPELAEMVAAGAGKAELLEAARSGGFVPIAAMARRAVREGETTVAEVVRHLGGSAGP